MCATNNLHTMDQGLEVLPSVPSSLAKFLSHRAYQEQVRLATRARQAWLAAPPESVLTRGCRHSCCRDPSTAVLGLWSGAHSLTHSLTYSLTHSSVSEQFQAHPGALLTQQTRVCLLQALCSSCSSNFMSTCGFTFSDIDSAVSVTCSQSC